MWHYIVPITALIVIGIQVYHVSVHGLSPWKAGGFGMYTTTHYTNYEILVNENKFIVDSLSKADFSAKKTFDRLRILPTEPNFKKAADLIHENLGIDSIEITLWKPTYNAANSEYILKKEYHFTQLYDQE